ncbi:MAG: M23 family metallopeptidase, partial [Actinomycetota bacterium]|nr:M23 family metallopeptidase [Actinomycetota bacterium]
TAAPAAAGPAQTVPEDTTTTTVDASDPAFDDTGDADVEEPDELEPLPGYTGGGPVIGDNPIARLEEHAWEQPVLVVGRAAELAALAAVAEAEDREAQYRADAEAAAAALAAAERSLAVLDDHIETASNVRTRAVGRHEGAVADLRTIAVASYIDVDSLQAEFLAELNADGDLDSSASVRRVSTDTMREHGVNRLREAEAALERAIVDHELLRALRPGKVDEVDQATESKADADELHALAVSELETLRGRAASASASVAGWGTGLDGLLQGSLVTFPIAGSWNFIDSWGFPRPNGRRHLGADVFAPAGTPLVAIEDGFITAGTNNLGGNVVYLEGVSGNTYYYAHVADWHPRAIEGGAVQAGDTIAYVGTSGNARGTLPHLHIGLKTAGSNPINPYPLLRALAEAVSVARSRGATPGIADSTVLALQPTTLIGLIEEGTVVLTPELAPQLPPETRLALEAAGIEVPEPPQAVGEPAQVGTPPAAGAPVTPGG